MFMQQTRLGCYLIYRQYVSGGADLFWPQLKDQIHAINQRQVGQHGVIQEDKSGH